MKEKILAIIFVIACSLSPGCASFTTDPYGYHISGTTPSIEGVIRASSDARLASVESSLAVEERRARLLMAKKCYEDYGPICASFGFGVSYYGHSGLPYGGSFYAPYDYTNLGLLAAGGAKNKTASGLGTTSAIDEVKQTAELADKKATRALKENYQTIQEVEALKRSK